MCARACACGWHFEITRQETSISQFASDGVQWRTEIICCVHNLHHHLKWVVIQQNRCHSLRAFPCSNSHIGQYAQQGGWTFLCFVCSFSRSHPSMLHSLACHTKKFVARDAHDMSSLECSVANYIYLVLENDKNHNPHPHSLWSEAFKINRPLSMRPRQTIFILSSEWMVVVSKADSLPIATIQSIFCRWPHVFASLMHAHKRWKCLTCEDLPHTCQQWLIFVFLLLFAMRWMWTLPEHLMRWFAMFRGDKSTDLVTDKYRRNPVEKSLNTKDNKC